MYHTVWKDASLTMLSGFTVHPEKVYNGFTVDNVNMMLGFKKIRINFSWCLTAIFPFPSALPRPLTRESGILWTEEQLAHSIRISSTVVTVAMSLQCDHSVILSQGTISHVALQQYNVRLTLSNVKQILRMWRCDYAQETGFKFSLFCDISNFPLCSVSHFVTVDPPKSLHCVWCSAAQNSSNFFRFGGWHCEKCCYTDNVINKTE